MVRCRLMTRLAQSSVRLRRWLVSTFVVVSLTGLFTVSAETRRETKEKLRKQLSILQQQFEQLKPEIAQKGEPITARQVTVGVVATFLPYIQEDLDNDEVERAAIETSYLDSLLKRIPPVQQDETTMITLPPATDAVELGRRLKVQNGTIVRTDPRESTRPMFLTGYGVFQRLRDDVEKLPTVGANFIQVEIGPSEVFPRPDTVDHVPLDRLLDVLNRAAKVGVAVDVLLSPHYFPEWMLAREPALRHRRESSVQYCIHHPEGLNLLRRHVRLVVEAIKNHPALLSVCLANEPQSIEEPCEFATRKWHSWLKTHHDGLTGFNSSHNARMHRFEEIALPDPFKPPQDRALWLDYIRFNQEDHAEWLGFLADTVHEIAPDLPVHVKAITPMLLGRTTKPVVGLDPTLLARFTGLNGNDGYNFLPSYLKNVVAARSDLVSGWQENAMGHDLQKSLNPAPVFNSENHLIVDRESRHIPPVHLRTALWQAAVHGQSATTIWVWDRSFDHKHDFWGSILERPDAVESVGFTNLDLNRTAIELSALQQTPSDVSILASISAQVWDKQVSTVTEALYTALSFTGQKIGFVTERQLEDGHELTTPRLFIPGNVHLSQGALTSLSRYHGRIVFVGDDALLNRNDHDQSVTNSGIVAETLGVGNGTDWRILWNELTTSSKRWLPEPNVTLRTPQGRPIWGVEWRSALSASDSWIVNLCNYRHKPVSFELMVNGKGVLAKDVLNKIKLQRVITLQSLETKLVRIATR